MAGETPNMADFNRNRVTNPDQSEVIRQRLYDWQLYPFAGTNQLTFFSTSLGQGLSTALGAAAGSTKTYHDTNMALSSQLPSGAAYYVESIEVVLFPGSSAAANTYLPALASSLTTIAATAVTAQANDVNQFYQSGLLELNILQKNYLRETPLNAFPPKVNFNIDAALSTNSATPGEVMAINSRVAGRPYYIQPAISIPPAMNFEVALKWPGLVAMPSGFNARVGLILDGYFMRASQ